MKYVIGVVVLLASLSIPTLSNAGVKNFIAVINGAQEIPPNPSTAFGLAHVSFDTANNNLCFEVTHTVAGEILAHIHGPDLPPGNGGIGAPVVVALPVGPSKTGCVLAPPPPFVKGDLCKRLH